MGGVFCGYAQTNPLVKPYLKTDVESLKSVFSFRKDYLVSKNFIRNNSKLLEPFIFYTFGEYDYFILSAVSDFNFPARYFREFYFEKSGQSDKLNIESKYSYFGITAQKTSEEFYYLFKGYIDLFPLIAIIHVKLSIRLLAEYRFNFQNIIEQHLSLKYKNNVKILAISAFSWNEFTIIACSNSYSLLQDIVIHLNSLCINEVPSLFDENKENKNNVFIKTETIFGFSSILFEENEIAVANRSSINICESDEILSIIRARIKSTRPISTANEVSNQLGTSYWTPGKFDLFIPNIFSDNNENNTNQFPSVSSSKGLVDKILRIWENDLIKDVRFETNLIVKVNKISSNNELSYIEDTYIYDNYHIYGGAIIEFEIALEKLKVPTSVRDIIINLLYTINQNLKDPIVQLNFVGISQSVKDNIKYIVAISSNAGTHSFYDIGEYIIRLAYSIKVGIENRLQCSYFTRNFAETYSLFQGGIQIPLICIEGLLDNLMSFFKLPKSVIVCVDYREGISISDNYLRLNYYHVYQPEKLISIICCEVAQDLINKDEFSNSPLYFYAGRKNEDISGIRILDDQIAIYLNATPEILEDYVDNYNEFQDYLTIDFFDHVIGDVFNFKIMYNSDLEYYSFWFWINFLLLTNSYLSNDQINQSLKLRFLIRFRLVLKITKKLDSKQWLNYFPNLNDPNLLSLSKKVDSYIVFLCKIPEFEYWLESAESEIDRILASFELKEKNGNSNYSINSDGLTDILSAIYLNRLEAIKTQTLWGFETSFSGGLNPLNVENAEFLMDQRLLIYEKLYKKRLLQL